MATTVRTRPAEPLWTRDFVLAMVVSFLAGLIFFLLMTTMALYAVERFGVADSLAGLAASMFVVGATVARLFAGNLVELVGRRRSLVASLVVYVVASLGYLPASSLELLLLVRLVHGMAFGIATTAVITIAQSLIPPLRRGEGTGYFSLSNTLSTAVGPFLAIALLRVSGYEAMFVGCAAVSAVATVVALALRAPAVELTAEHRARLRRFRPKDLLHGPALPVAAFMLVMGVAVSGVITFVNPYAAAEGLERGGQWFFLLYAAALFVSRFVLGRVQDVYGDNVVMYPMLGSFAAGLLVLSAARSDAVLVLSGVLLGAGFGTLMSAAQAAVVAEAPAHRLGVAVSTYFFMLDSGVGLGPIVLGVLAEHTDFRTMYLVSGVLVALSALLYHRVHGHRRRGPGRPGA